MTAPAAESVVEVAGPAADGEFPVNFPVLVIEGLDTSDGRYLAAGSLAHRALPLSLLAQPESMHGGEDAGPAGVVGRIDTLTRTPGPEVISRRTGQPFPEGTFIWSGTGHMDVDARVGEYDVAKMFRKGHLRGISVDLAGMDYEVLGDESPVDPEFPRRQLVVNGADLAAATLVPVPAFGDAYAELADDPAAMVPPTPADLPEGLAASAAPAWRSAEVGDQLPRAAIVAAAEQGLPVRIPPDSVEQITAVIEAADAGDATGLAERVVEHIAVNWALTEPVTADELPEEGEMATDTAALADEQPADDAELEDEGDPAEPQACIYDDQPATHSLLYQDGEQFVSVCDEHDARAREELAKAGETVSGEVAIEGAEAPVEEEPVVASAAVDVFLDDVLPANNTSRARPPLAWFQDPGLTEKTPITIDGQRVFGHIAPWDEPHIGFNGQKIYPPRSRTDYKYFRYGGLRADDNGTTRIVGVSHLTIATGHADMHLGVDDTRRHYDHSGYSWAKVAVGEDRFGVWVAGVLSPGITDEQIEAALAHPPSGDWRPVPEGGIELCAVLSVNVPGFGITRARVASGQVQALIAGGSMQPRRVGHDLDVDSLADAIAARLDARREAGELSAAHQALFAELDETPAVVAALLAEVDDAPSRAAELFAELDGDDIPAEELQRLAEMAADDGMSEADFVSQMPPQLQKSYLTGKVAARIRWNSPGDFSRCVAQAKKHGMGRKAEGACNALHKKATGMYPGDRRNR